LSLEHHSLLEGQLSDSTILDASDSVEYRSFRLTARVKKIIAKFSEVKVIFNEITISVVFSKLLLNILNGQKIAKILN